MNVEGSDSDYVQKELVSAHCTLTQSWSSAKAPTCVRLPDSMCLTKNLVRALEKSGAYDLGLRCVSPSKGVLASVLVRAQNGTNQRKRLLYFSMTYDMAQRHETALNGFRF